MTTDPQSPPSQDKGNPLADGAVFTVQRHLVTLLNDLLIAKKRLDDEPQSAADFFIQVSLLRDWLALAKETLPPAPRAAIKASLRPLWRAARRIVTIHLQLTWLKQQRSHLAAHQVPGAYWLLKRWQQRCQNVPLARVRQLADTVASHGQSLTADNPEAPQFQFGGFLASGLQRQSRQVQRRLTALESRYNTKGLERARRAMRRTCCLLDRLPQFSESAEIKSELLQLDGLLQTQHHNQELLSRLRQDLKRAARDQRQSADMVTRGEDPLAPHIRRRVETDPLLGMYQIATLADNERSRAHSTMQQRWQAIAWRDLPARLSDLAALLPSEPVSIADILA